MVEEDVAALRRAQAGVPARFATNTGWRPPAGKRYQVVQVIDDYNTIGVDDVRFRKPEKV
jgi:hypothetical protein